MLIKRISSGLTTQNNWRIDVDLVVQNSDGNAFCMISMGEYISFFVILESAKTTAAPTE